jgi:hydroxyacylglutathione hydrolase
LKENTEIKLGDAVFRILFTPGHSPGSVCFYNAAEKYVIAGDVLFKGSIGRTDLPGGNYDTLIHSIKTQLLSLPDDVVVYNGHGPSTTIGAERRSNPFLRT